MFDSSRIAAGPQLELGNRSVRYERVYRAVPCHYIHQSAADMHEHKTTIVTEDRAQQSERLLVWLLQCEHP